MRDGCVISDCEDSATTNALVHSSNLPLKFLSAIHDLNCCLVCIRWVVSFVFAREASAKQVSSGGLCELLPADLLSVSILNYRTYELIQNVELFVCEVTERPEHQVIRCYGIA